jgi:cytochrome b pre-mRNA-processing protein 3
MPIISLDGKFIERDCLQFIELGMNKEHFRTWFAMTILHVWLVNTRFKAEGLPGKDAKQELFNHIWIDVDIRLNKAGVKARVGKIMEDLVDSYYGQSLAYAEGLVKGDAVLASAIWRFV